MDIHNKELSLRAFVSSLDYPATFCEVTGRTHSGRKTSYQAANIHCICRAFLLLLPYSLKFKALKDLSKCYAKLRNIALTCLSLASLIGIASTLSEQSRKKTYILQVTCMFVPSMHFLVFFILDTFFRILYLSYVTLVYNVTGFTCMYTWS